LPFVPVAPLPGAAAAAFAIKSFSLFNSLA
jgi:hypothetical protein